MDDSKQGAGPLDEREVLKIELGVLRSEHRALDEQIIELERGPAPEALLIRSLKQRKLALKDQIAALEERVFPDIIA